ncbi:MAG: type II toxin-antitoxin system prevent-host-death family antitoxin [Anaerolineae bacterium]
MPQQHNLTFEPLEMMDLRGKPGSVLDAVFDQQKRYIIRRKGTPKALIVPITDRRVIEQAVSKRDVAKMYTALQKMTGMIKDNVTDAAEKIDQIVYGEAYDQTHQEVNG